MSAFNGHGIPALCLASALNYFDAFRCGKIAREPDPGTARLFGAHTYQRLDKDGTFHTPDWAGEVKDA